jgi:Cytochrome P460
MRLVLSLIACAAAGLSFWPQAATPNAPTYTADGSMNLPANYREWIYLSTGMDMSYRQSSGAASEHMFDNVFVNPEAYKAFRQTGHWPDKTVFVLEGRGARSNASINKAGHFQSEEMMGIEVHVKDDSRGGWSFYDFDGNGPGKRFPDKAECYSCHQAHGAVDTTFVQFYPTMLPIAREKGTLSAEYLKDEAQEKK